MIAPDTMTEFESDVLSALAKVFPETDITTQYEVRNSLPGYRMWINGEKMKLWLSATLCDDIVLQTGMNHDQVVIRVATAMANTIAQHLHRDE